MSVGDVDDVPRWDVVQIRKPSAWPLRGSPEWHAAQRAQCRKDFEAWKRSLDRDRELAYATLVMRGRC